jgi:hypothetical protein
MYTIKASDSLFQFLTKKHHSVSTIRDNVRDCLGLPVEMVAIPTVDNEYPNEWNENALVYLSIDYRTDGFLSFVELGILKYESLNMPIEKLLLCLNKLFDDDIAAIIDDETILLARDSRMFIAEGDIITNDKEDLLFIKEDSVRSA